MLSRQYDIINSYVKRQNKAIENFKEAREITEYNLLDRKQKYDS